MSNKLLEDVKEAFEAYRGQLDEADQRISQLEAEIEQLKQELINCQINIARRDKGDWRYRRIMSVYWMIQRGENEADVEDLFELLREFDRD